MAIIRKKNLLFVFFFAFFLFFCTSEEFPSRIVTIPFGETTLLAKIYVFNSIEEGERIAESVYGIKDLRSIVSKGKFKYLRPLMIGHEIENYNYGIFKYGYEFWILKNVRDSKLYGMGCFVNE